MKVEVADGLTIVLSGAGKGCGGRTYTLRGQDVYVSCPRRIRFTLETYAFSPQNVYVRTKEGIGSISTTCGVGDLDAGGAGEELGRGGVKKGSTVGRISDPQWVVDATYRRFF